MASDDEPKIADDNYWETSAIAEQAEQFFEREGSNPQMCGVNLNGVRELGEQVKHGLGNIQGCFSDSMSDEMELESKNRFDLIPPDLINTIVNADNIELPFATRSFSTESEELDLLRRFYESRWSPSSINSIITASLLGKPYSLEQYTSLSLKKELLKAAEISGDGDLILNVVLFLNRTLNNKLFNDILLQSLTAAKHYINYLSTTKRISVATDTLAMLGKSRDAAMMMFSDACTNPQRMLPKLKACLRNHFNEERDKVFLVNAIKLLEWQEGYEGGKLVGASVSTCLSELCLNHWGVREPSHHSPLTFQCEQGVSDRLYQWTALISRSKSQAWPDIDTIFLTKGWLGEKKVKTELPLEEVVTALCTFGAPQTILSFYLCFIDNLDRRLALAKKLKCHRAAMDVFVILKDRLSLLHYKADLIPHSEDDILAEKYLKNAAVKWKN